MKRLFLIACILMSACASFGQYNWSQPGSLFKLGSPNTNNKDLFFDINNGATNPLLRANGSTDKLQWSHEGTTFYDMGVVSVDRSVKPLQMHSSTGNVQAARNIGIATSVGSNALTVSFKQANGSTDASSSDVIDFYFRGTTDASGAFDHVALVGSKSLVVPSGATLGTTNATAAFLYVYALSDTTLDICISKAIFSDQVLNSATAMDTASDSGTVLYCNAAHTTKPTRLLGKLTATEATAGTWATAVSKVDLMMSSFDASSAVVTTGLTRTDFTASGTLVVPAGVSTVIYREVGGGGGGGGCNANTAGGGGGGGQILEGVMEVTPAETLTVTVGAAGTAGAPGGGTAGDGGNSIIAGGTRTITARGGKGGGNTNAQGGSTQWPGGTGDSGGGGGACWDGYGGNSAAVNSTGVTPAYCGGGGSTRQGGGASGTGGAGGPSKYAAGGLAPPGSQNRGKGGGGGAGLEAGGNGGDSALQAGTAGGIGAGGGGNGEQTGVACSGFAGGAGYVTIIY